MTDAVSKIYVRIRVEIRQEEEDKPDKTSELQTVWLLANNLNMGLAEEKYPPIRANQILAEVPAPRPRFFMNLEPSPARDEDAPYLFNLNTNPGVVTNDTES